MTNDEFQAFVRHENTGPGRLRFIAWCPYVQSERRAAFESAARTMRPDFALTEWEARDPLPPEARGAYLPVLYLEEFNGTDFRVGNDLGADRILYHAAMRAAVTGETIAAAPEEVSRPDGMDYRILVFAPVYRKNTDPKMGGRNPGNLDGLVVGAFDIGAAALHSIMDLAPLVGLDSQIFDEAPDSAKLRVFYYASRMRDGPATPPSEEDIRSSLHTVATLDVGRRPMTLFIYPAPQFFALRNTREAEGTLSAGLAITGLMTAFLVLSSRRVREVAGLAEALTGTNERLKTENAQRALAESELRAREERIRGIMDNVADAIITTDQHGAIESVNGAAERLFGYSAAEATGMNISEFIAEPHRGDYQRKLANSPGARQGGVAGNGLREVKGQRKDGSVFIMDLAMSQIAAEGDRRLIAVARDITQKKEAEQRLFHAQKMETVGHLTGGVAHDFNNLLTVILGSLELLKDGSTGPAGSKLIEAAIRACGRGADLTQRLLAFSRKQTLQPVPTDINKLVSGMTELLQRTLGERIVIETVLAAGLWPATVDPGQMESTLLNLAVNARDAMPEGGKLTLETANVRLDEAYAERHTDLTPGQYVLVAVSDTGTGMTPEVAERAFDPFFTTKEVGKGSGLGLSMVYGFVRQSRGHVKIYSEVAQGTTVKIYLPKASRPGMQTADREPQPTQVPTGHETVLVVEDDPDIRMFIVSVLTGLGYSVLTAEHGRAAMRVVDGTDNMHLLLTDVVLPEGLSGSDLAKWVKQRRPETKILFTSGYTENSIVHHGRLDEGVQLLAKPFTKQALAKKVRYVLDTPERR
ncbi:MAG: PAS domain S-box protein [Alphaproteobacteria bacterium]